MRALGIEGPHSVYGHGKPERSILGVVEGIFEVAEAIIGMEDIFRT